MNTSAFAATLRQAMPYVEKLKKAVEGLTSEQLNDIAVFGPRVVEAMKDCPCWVFWQIDEHPGRYDGYGTDWFVCLRRVRNNAEWGPRLFEQFTE